MCEEEEQREATARGENAANTFHPCVNSRNERETESEARRSHVLHRQQPQIPVNAAYSDKDVFGRSSVLEPWAFAHRTQC